MPSVSSPTSIHSLATSLIPSSKIFLEEASAENSSLFNHYVTTERCKSIIVPNTQYIYCLLDIIITITTKSISLDGTAIAINIAFLTMVKDIHNQTRVITTVISSQNKNRWMCILWYDVHLSHLGTALNLLHPHTHQKNIHTNRQRPAREVVDMKPP